jgi:hypothetical protein
MKIALPDNKYVETDSIIGVSDIYNDTNYSQIRKIDLYTTGGVITCIVATSIIDEDDFEAWRQELVRVWSNNAGITKLKDF